MIKNRLYTLALITCLCCSFIGCGKSDKNMVLETSDIFLQAAMDCDMETLSKQCNE